MFDRNGPVAAPSGESSSPSSRRASAAAEANMIEHLSTDQLVDFVHGELTPQDDARAHAHLSSCTLCRADVDAEMTVREFLRNVAAADEREMPSSIKAAIWEEIRAAKPGPFAAFAALLRPAIAVPLGALLLLGGYFASPLARHEAQPTIAASYYLQAHAVQSAQSPLSERAAGAVYEASTTANNQASIANAYDGGYPATAAYGKSR